MWGEAYVQGDSVLRLGGVPVRPEWVEYRSFDLTGAKSLTLTGEGEGSITVHRENSQPLGAGTFTGGSLTIPLTPTDGVHPIWVCVTGKMDLHTVCLNQS
jgi:hypothetical protein